MIPQTPEQRISALEEELQRLQETNVHLQHRLDVQKAQFKEELYTDPITGLQNKQALHNDIGKSGFPTLFLMRINDIERYFDLYGYDVVNEVLEQFSQILEAYNDEKGYRLYHIGTDVFAMLYPSEFIDTEKFEGDLFEFLEIIDQNPLYLPMVDESIYLDVNIGIASGEEDLLKHAYNALSVSRTTKKRFIYFHPYHSQREEHLKTLHVKREIQDNIESGNFLPVFQPIVDSDGVCIKYETLIRMRQNGELVSPWYFLDIAAKTHQYEEISQRTLLRAIEIFKNKTEKLSLNFTLADIQNKELLRFLEKELYANNMAERCVFEIVESEAIDDYDSLRDFVTRFRKLGVQIAIDDFGTGYANFSHIMELEPEYLKIDGSLIKNIMTNHNSHVMVTSIIYFARKLGIKTIAEFVSEKEIFEHLKELGIDEFQGYYFGKPEPL